MMKYFGTLNQLTEILHTGNMSFKVRAIQGGTQFRFDNDIKLNFYPASGSLVVQGKKDRVASFSEGLEYLLEWNPVF